MLTNSLPDFSSRFDRSVEQLPATSMLLSLDGSFRLDARQGERVDDRASWQRNSSAMGAIDVAVEVAPSDIVKRRAVAWRGMAAEIVQSQPLRQSTE
jgi:hypothetical protein